MNGGVRPARTDDSAALRAIEQLAGERFRQVGLAAIADDEPPALETLDAYAAAGRSWVACDSSGQPVGYLLIDAVDGCAHVEQVSVRPDWQGRGIGRSLLAAAEGWAVQRSLAALTLTTFDQVPWNRPLYEHLGFRVLREEEIGPELRAVCAAELAHGLGVAARVCMRRELGWAGG